MTTTALMDLILRPTRLEPGQYTEQGESFVVIRHTSGRLYQMIWCHAGEGRKYIRQGDTLFEHAFIKETQRIVDATFEEVELPPARIVPALPPARSRKKPVRKSKPQRKAR